MTNDLDILVALSPPLVGSFRAAFAEGWYVPDAGLDEAVRAAGSFNLIHLEWMDKVDFFVAGQGLLQQAALERAVPLRVGSANISFYTAEDIILQKLDWLRRSGLVVERQRTDVLGVMKANRRALDRPYLVASASEVGLGELLEACLVDSGLAAE